MGAYTGLTRAQQRMLDQVKADGEITLNGHGLRTARILAARGSLVLDEDTSTVRPRCGTLYCGRAATERISYTYRSPVPGDLEHEAEVDTDLVCTPCAEGYARRPALRGLTRVPLDPTVPVLQLWRDGWTALNSKGSWATLRPASPAEIELSASTHHGQFWLRSDGTSYLKAFAASNADQLARVTVPAGEAASLS